MTGLSDAIGREIILRHFPDADPAVVDRHALWLSPPLVAALTPYYFVKEGDQVEVQIETFKRAIAEAWRAYQALPLHIRRGTGIDGAGFFRLARAAAGVAVGKEPTMALPPAIQVMRSNASAADRLSAQALAADHPAKIALVEKARDAWRDLTGAEPPMKTSDGAAFLEFVQDLIECAGKTWGAEKALAAWRTAETNLAR